MIRRAFGVYVRRWWESQKGKGNVLRTLGRCRFQDLLLEPNFHRFCRDMAKTGEAWGPNSKSEEVKRRWYYAMAAVIGSIALVQNDVNDRSAAMQLAVNQDGTEAFLPKRFDKMIKATAGELLSSARNAVRILRGSVNIADFAVGIAAIALDENQNTRMHWIEVYYESRKNFDRNEE